MKKKPCFLLCNDDGVHAPGIRALAEAVEPFADWVMVAPNIERSGAGQGISLTMPLRVEKQAANIYSLEGTPTDCVMFALAKIMDRPPDLLLSGINRGPNIGQDTLYSGTIAAAMEGCLKGIPAIALSLAKPRAFEQGEYSEAIKVVRMLLERPDLLKACRTSVLNVNIPGVPLPQMAGFAVCRLGRRLYDHQVVEKIDPRGRPYYWIGGGGHEFEPTPGTDCVRLAENFVTLTALSPDHADVKVNDAILASLEDSCATFGTPP